MTVYSYSRTTEIEAMESGSQLEELLEKESLRLHTYALRIGIRVNENILDQGLLWSVDMTDRIEWQKLLGRLETGDIVITCTIERMFSSCEDMQATVRLLRKRKAPHVQCSSSTTRIFGITRNSAPRLRP